MSETKVEADPSAWLVAYAIGLVVSHDPMSLRGPCAGEFARAAMHDRVALELARRRLAGVTTVGPALRAAAVALVDAAIVACRSHRAADDVMGRLGLPCAVSTTYGAAPPVPWPGSREAPTEPDPCAGMQTVHVRQDRASAG